MSRRRASVIIVIVLLLAAASVMIFAGQAMALGMYRESLTRYRHAAALLAARGGIHYAVASMATYGQPAQILPPQNATPPDFYQSFRGGDQKMRTGWFVADRPYPPSGTGDAWGIRSEQARIPVNSIPPSSAVTADLYLPALGQTVGQAVKTYVTQRTARSDPKNQQGLLFRHPLELLNVDGVERAHLFGNDQNDDHLHHADSDTGMEGAGAISGFQPLDAACPDLDRGLLDRITTFTDGKIDLYNTFALDPELAAAYIGAVFDQNLVSALKVQAAGGRSPLVTVQSSNPAWVPFARKYLTDVPTFFRVQVWGTYDGAPLAVIELVTEFMQEQSGSATWFRIAHWREN